VSVGSSRLRLWALRAAAVLLGVGLFAGAELTLRGMGIPAPPASPALPEASDGGTWLVTPSNRAGYLRHRTGDDGVAVVQTAQHQRQQKFMHSLSWTLEPAAGTLRIFCFGGSSTLGSPFEDRPALTFPARLDHHLEQAGVDAEVINLGGASFGSDHVVELMRAVSGQGAAAYVVYSGNNEFFNYALGLAQLNRGYLHTPRTVAQLHTFELLEGWLRRSRSNGTDPLLVRFGEHEYAQRKLVQARVLEALTRGGDGARPVASSDGVLRRRDQHYRAVMDRYAENAQSMVELAASEPSRPLLLLFDLPANLGEQPWLPVSDPGQGLIARWRWDRLMGKASASADEHDHPATVQHARAASRVDPVNAQAYFIEGMAQANDGPLAEAWTSLQQALELDMDPGRPLAEQGEILRRVAAGQPGVVVRDLESEFDWRRPGIVNSELFYDSCHLTAKGYDTVGRVAAQVLVSALSEGSGMAGDAPVPEAPAP